MENAEKFSAFLAIFNVKAFLRRKRCDPVGGIQQTPAVHMAVYIFVHETRSVLRPRKKRCKMMTMLGINVYQ
jgi:hypothetical protein